MPNVNIKPLSDRIIVSRKEKEEKTPGGILIPDSAKEKPVEGEVLAVGPGRSLDNGQTASMQVSVGQKVLFGKYAGTEIKIQGQEYVVLREDDVIGIIE